MEYSEQEVNQWIREYNFSHGIVAKRKPIPEPLTIEELQQKMKDMESEICVLKLKKMGITLDTSTPGEISIIRSNR